MSSLNHISTQSVSGSGWKRNSGPLNTRDELLMSLMASEAVVDSRGFDILTAEEVEDLKKEHQLMTSRLGAMTKKLALETKIRDAALSLSKVNSSHKKTSQQTTDQLNAANDRVDSTQREYWNISNRINEVHTKLMEHRAGVLSFSVRTMEKDLSSQSRTRFDGAHLFAGHAETVAPKRKVSAEAAAAELEENLKAARNSLVVAGKKHAEMARELSMIRLEKQEVETRMGMDLQTAEETIGALEKEIPRLQKLESEVRRLREEKGTLERERAELKERGKEVEVLQARLADMKPKTGEGTGTAKKILADIREDCQRQIDEKESQLAEKESQLAEKGSQLAEKESQLAEKESQIVILKQQAEADHIAWQRERDEKMKDLARLRHDIDRLRESDGPVLQQVSKTVNTGLSKSLDLIKKHGIVLLSRDSSVQGVLNAIDMHIQTLNTKMETYARAESEWDVSRRRLEDDVKNGLEKRETLSRELKDARRERDAARSDTSIKKDASPRLEPCTPSTTTTLIPDDNNDDKEVQRIISILQPLWAILPSPEARAAKFENTNQRSYRTDSPISSAVSSLSELDVRSLKSLYDATRQNSTNSLNHNETFTIEAFAAQVRALINDDRALIERLVRFAQAHDMLKKNADRAQKLAKEGTLALETYQKQVRTLEETIAKQAANRDDIRRFEETIERLESEKRELEGLAAEQAETCAQLNEANNTLSSRALTLAEEAAKAPEVARKQFESQLNECRKALDAAKGEADEIRSSEQSQKVVLLDELNEMQTENANLRTQLRAVKKLSM